ncbi:MAG: His/Gly/Thr/Pro-type tRNA ligase C-terminal domain-containing protein, partial [Myxococcota bacterium]
VQFRTVTGREETASTNQLDFAVPKRFDLTYTASDDTEKTPYCIHRAPLGTHERFVAFLIEHYGGAFPTWLSPVQARFLTVADRYKPYAQEIADRLRQQFVRADVDPTSERVGKLIRMHTQKKIPNLIIVGEREAEDGTVTLRRYGHQEQETMPVAEFEERLLRSIRTRSKEFVSAA